LYFIVLKLTARTQTSNKGRNKCCLTMNSITKSKSIRKKHLITHSLLNTPRTISLLPPELDVSRDSTRGYWTYHVNLLKDFYLIVFFYYQSFAGSKRRELFIHARVTLSISYILIPLPIFSINAISDNGFLSLGVNAFCFSLSGSTWYVS
jgi:hypothetical protein